MKNCPHCGGELPAAKKKPSARGSEQVIEVRDGVTWYGTMTKYSDGERMTFSTVPDDGKPRKLAKWVKYLIKARAQGLFTPLPDDANAFWAEYHTRAVAWAKDEAARKARKAAEHEEARLAEQIGME